MSALLERWTGYAWRSPQWLWLALLVPVALWLGRRRGPAAVRTAVATFVRDDAGRPTLPATRRMRLARWPMALEVAGLLAMIAALARPTSSTSLPLETEGVDILLCLDTSSSMAARDLDPTRTRLQIAQDAAIEFLAGRRDDRVGLVTFARWPDVRCPLTLDHETLRTMLAGVRTVASDGPEDATGLGAAVARAAEVLSGGGAKSRVVILLTDGEENVAQPGAKDAISPAEAAAVARRLQARVYAIVAGAEGAAAIDTGPVERCATRTGGAMFRAKDAEAVRAVYARIDELERSAFVEPRSRASDAFLPFVAAGLALLLLGRFLASTWLAVSP